MMGRRQKMNGRELDALTRAKRFYKFKAGFRSWLKRCVNKRSRKDARKEIGEA